MRQILGRQDIELLKFQVHRASDWTGPATSGVYHLTGSGRDQEREVEWSLVLKVLSLTSEGSNPATSSETHVLYWKREALVYQSDLLDDLPGGVRGPRCYGIVEHADSSVWLWLEDVKEIYGPRWPLEQCARAAQSLGQMNGAYLAGRPLPASCDCGRITMPCSTCLSGSRKPSVTWMPGAGTSLQPRRGMDTIS